MPPHDMEDLDVLEDLYWHWWTATNGGKDQSLREFFGKDIQLAAVQLDRLEEYARDVEVGKQFLSPFFDSVSVPAIPGIENPVELGRGGNGVVYKGREAELNREVAIKVLHSGSFSDLLLAEARKVGAFDVAGERDSIVRIYYRGRLPDGREFFVMELCDQSLAQRWNRRQQNDREVAKIVEQISTALQFIHGRLVIHGDIKPGNVLLSGQTVKISDFGHARYVGDTSDGLFLGTRQYCAPERFDKGTTPDVRADVYAIGAIIYEGLVGTPPFADPSATLEHRIRFSQPVPPNQQRKVALDLEAICLKCLAKQPDERYATAQEVADELGRFLRNEPVKARPIGTYERSVKWCRRNPGKAAAFFVPSVLSVALIMAIFAINVARDREQEARGYAEEVFEWSFDSLGQFENALRYDKAFKDDAKYRELQVQLLTISQQHYKKIANLKRSDPRHFPALESRRGVAFWWLGIVEVHSAHAAGTESAKRQFFDNALIQFSKMQTIYRELRSLYPTNADYEYCSGWSCGWKGYVLNMLGRDEEATRECENGILILKDCHHPQARIKMGACMLELAVIAARRRDGKTAHALVEAAAKNLDAAPISSDAFIERDRRYYRADRLENVGHELANAGLLQSAAMIYQRLTIELPENAWHWYHHAIAELGQGNEAAFRQERSELLTRFGEGNAPSDRIAYLYLVLPLDESTPNERGALEAVAQNLPDLRARAAIWYRLGRFKDALSCLEQTNHGRAWDHVVFALSFAGVGQPENAKNHLEAARSWLEKVKAGTEWQGWNEEVEIQYLLREAEKLVLQ